MQGTSCNTALAAASAANLTGTQWWMLTNFYEIFIYLPILDYIASILRMQRVQCKKQEKHHKIQENIKKPMCI